jgi:hypothetical protein
MVSAHVSQGFNAMKFDLGYYPRLPLTTLEGFIRAGKNWRICLFPWATQLPPSWAASFLCWEATRVAR